MGAAEIISLEEVRARKQWTTLRHQLHERFDRWLDALEDALREPPSTLSDVTQVVWELRQSLTGSVTEAIVQHAYTHESAPSSACCPQCAQGCKSRGPVRRTLDTMVGPVQVSRTYFYCAACHQGWYPLDTALALATGRKQFDVQQAAAKLVAELPYDTAHKLFTELTGIRLGTERMHTLTNQMAEGLTVLDVAPSRQEIAQAVDTLAVPHQQCPVMVLAIDGAHVPTRPETARGRCVERQCHRAKRPHWQGQYREAKGIRWYLLDEARIVHVLSWHQGQTDREVAEALRQIKEAGLIPDDRVRMCVIADGAPWIWKQVQPIFPHAQQVLDYYHCAQHVHAVATEHYGQSLQALEWREATMTRLFCGDVGRVIGGLKRMEAVSTVAAKTITKLIGYLHEHRPRLNYDAQRQAGYPLGSGGIESANKFICHVRLKRSGAWWYETNSNQMLALRCAKYNGTFERVFARYRQRHQGAKK